MFETDRTPIKVTKENFETYVLALIDGKFSPFSDDYKQARLVTNLSADQIMYIKVHFKDLSHKYKWDMFAQTFR
tara:strand:+ start:2554 stop:2775 length:222 start_codon:yes stop_codon:yes gene_type:complete